MQIISMSSLFIFFENIFKDVYKMHTILLTPVSFAMFSPLLQRIQANFYYLR
jgi:hypothetical protein